MCRSSAINLFLLSVIYKRFKSKLAEHRQNIKQLGLSPLIMVLDDVIKTFIYEWIVIFITNPSQIVK